MEHVFALHWFASQLLSSLFFPIDFVHGKAPIPEFLYRPHPYFKVFSCFFQQFKFDFSSLSIVSLLSFKKSKSIYFLYQVIHFAASFRIVNHEDQNHVSKQFYIFPMFWEFLSTRGQSKQKKNPRMSTSGPARGSTQRPGDRM